MKPVVVLVLAFLFAVYILPHGIVSMPTALADSGRELDVYTQHPAPYGGQGPGQLSYPFRPLMEVDLYAKVLYSGWPVARIAVSYRVQHGMWDFTLSGTTNSSGIALVKFTVPWLGNDTRTMVVGVWNVTATAYVAEQLASDTLWFYAMITDLNCDGKVDVMDMAIVGAAYGSYPTLPKWNPVADVNHDGKVDILDLALVIKDYGWEMPRS